MKKEIECKKCADKKDHDWGLCECKCHQPPKNSWEKEFKKRFTSTGLECDGDLTGYTSEAIDFIRQLLSQTRQETLKEVLPEEKTAIDFSKNPGQEEDYVATGFNSCLSQIKKSAKEKFNIEI